MTEVVTTESAADDRADHHEAPPRARPSFRDWWVGATALMGLAGLAITQPVLDLFGRNPEFFVAGRYGRREIVVFAVLVALVPSLVAIAASTVALFSHPRLGAIVHAAALAGFTFLFGLVLLDNLGIEAVVVAIVVAAGLAALVVWLARTRPLARTALSYLGIGNVAFLLLFLLASPTAEIVLGGSAENAGAVAVPEPPGPVVFVVLDEFPVTTIMRPDGTINEARYPNFARLADSSAWFRNASSLSPMTSQSVPSMLTGTVPEAGALPSYHDHPDNLLTMFGTRYPVNLYESVTDMCPPSLCDPGPRGSLRGALRDGAVVYGHQVLPGDLADGLPSIDHSWGGFGDDLQPSDATDATGSGSASTAATTDSTAAQSVVGDDGYGRWHSLDEADRSALGQATIMAQWASSIDDRPSVNFLHVALPHFPWTLTPWGTRLTQFPGHLYDEDTSFDPSGTLRYQLHSLQVGAADAAIGEMIDQLQAAGTWDDALVVVGSDHGVGLLAPDFGRTLTEDNSEELLRIPLFIKAPGQETGEVRDDVAHTVDILPSVIDLLGGEADWPFDGHSLYDGSRSETEPRVDESLEPALDIATRHAEDLGGEDWDGLAAVGIGRDLVGTPVADLTVGEPSPISWSAIDEETFASLPTPDGRVPHLVAGRVTTPDDAEPAELLLSVNGTIAGVAGTASRDDGEWQLWGVVAPYFQDGANTVEAYEVESTPQGPVLHPAGST